MYFYAYKFKPKHVAMKLETNRTNCRKQRDGTPTQLLRGHWLPRELTEREVVHPSSHPLDVPLDQQHHQPSPQGGQGFSLCSSHPASLSSAPGVQLLVPKNGQQEQHFAFTLRSQSTHRVSRVSLRELLTTLTGASKWKIAAAMQIRGGSATQILQQHLCSLSPTPSPQGARQVQSWLITGGICT